MTEPVPHGEAQRAAPGPRQAVPAVPAVVAGPAAVAWLSADGELDSPAAGTAAQRCREAAPMLVHGRATARRLGLGAGIAGAFDLLELVAFTRPAQFCLPTAPGLAQVLCPDRAPRPSDLAANAALLPELAGALLHELAGLPARDAERAAGIAWHMSQGGWPWAPYVLAALGYPDGGPRTRAALRVWESLPEWQEEPAPPPPAAASVAPDEARGRLGDLLGRAGLGEDRPQQADYASAVTEAFTPRDEPGTPNTVLAEAGTGVGKTLGYLAPAGVWAEKAGGTVWISTYTRNLQHQIDGELAWHYGSQAEKNQRAVVRKGRENYLCLLNLEEATRQLHTAPQAAVAVGLMARWTLATRDGDLGGDLPNWLVELLGRANTVGLSDHRGECIYAACPHYGRCFIERSARKARKADIVIANHALAIVQAARGDDPAMPTRFVFDEGHHVFEAADNAFALALTGQEAGDLRRWLRGAEGSGRSRARGLKRRLEDAIEGDVESQQLLDAALSAAAGLPGDGWRGRVMPAEADRAAAQQAGDLMARDGQASLTAAASGPAADLPPGYMPSGPAETLLAHVHVTALARARDASSIYSLEADPAEPPPGLQVAGERLDQALDRLASALSGLVDRMRARLEEEADSLDSTTRNRLDSMARSIERRALDPVRGWRRMLAALWEGTPGDFVDWLEVTRHQDGRDVDVGLHRRWVDPSRPFAATMARHAHGLVVTSATLTDGTGSDSQDWAAAEERTGAGYLPAPPVRARVASPFQYGEQARVLIVTDVPRDQPKQVAAAYRSLFTAAGGGALGLFTAIQRLRGVHREIAAPLGAAGYPLYAQHVDALDVTTLIDIFRAEAESCLLGTDAVRDGVDVPGQSLRLIVFDRVPWPRPSLVHKARREAFGRKRWDELLTRLRLKQAFGRLVRKSDDRGVFVLLDPRMPSRLYGAFPEGVRPQRVGLKEASETVAGFLG